MEKCFRGHKISQLPTCAVLFLLFAVVVLFHEIAGASINCSVGSLVITTNATLEWDCPQNVTVDILISPQAPASISLTLGSVFNEVVINVSEAARQSSVEVAFWRPTVCVAPANVTVCGIVRVTHETVLDQFTVKFSTFSQEKWLIVNSIAPLVHIESSAVILALSVDVFLDQPLVLQSAAPLVVSETSHLTTVQIEVIAPLISISAGTAFPAAMLQLEADLDVDEASAISYTFVFEAECFVSGREGLQNASVLEMRGNPSAATSSITWEVNITSERATVSSGYIMHISDAGRDTFAVVIAAHVSSSKLMIADDAALFGFTNSSAADSTVTFTSCEIHCSGGGSLWVTKSTSRTVTLVNSHVVVDSAVVTLDSAGTILSLVDADSSTVNRVGMLLSSVVVRNTMIVVDSQFPICGGWMVTARGSGAAIWTGNTFLLDSDVTMRIASVQLDREVPLVPIVAQRGDCSTMPREGSHSWSPLTNAQFDASSSFVNQFYPLTNVVVVVDEEGSELGRMYFSDTCGLAGMPAASSINQNTSMVLNLTAPDSTTATVQIAQSGVWRIYSAGPRPIEVIVAATHVSFVQVIVTVDNLTSLQLHDVDGMSTTGMFTTANISVLINSTLERGVVPGAWLPTPVEVFGVTSSQVFVVFLKSITAIAYDAPIVSVYDVPQYRFHLSIRKSARVLLQEAVLYCLVDVSQLPLRTEFFFHGDLVFNASTASSTTLPSNFLHISVSRPWNPRNAMWITFSGESVFLPQSVRVIGAQQSQADVSLIRLSDHRAAPDVWLGTHLMFQNVNIDLLLAHVVYTTNIVLQNSFVECADTNITTSLPRYVADYAISLPNGTVSNWSAAVTSCLLYFQYGGISNTSVTTTRFRSATGCFIRLEDANITRSALRSVASTVVGVQFRATAVSNETTPCETIFFVDAKSFISDSAMTFNDSAFAVSTLCGWFIAQLPTVTASPSSCVVCGATSITFLEGVVLLSSAATAPQNRVGAGFLTTWENVTVRSSLAWSTDSFIVIVSCNTTFVNQFYSELGSNIIPDENVVSQCLPCTNRSLVIRTSGRFIFNCTLPHGADPHTVILIDPVSDLTDIELEIHTVFSSIEVRGVASSVRITFESERLVSALSSWNGKRNATTPLISVAAHVLDTLHVAFVLPPSESFRFVNRSSAGTFPFISVELSEHASTNIELIVSASSIEVEDCGTILEVRHNGSAAVGSSIAAVLESRWLTVAGNNTSVLRIVDKNDTSSSTEPSVLSSVRLQVLSQNSFFDGDVNHSLVSVQLSATSIDEMTVTFGPPPTSGLPGYVVLRTPALLDVSWLGQGVLLFSMASLQLFFSEKFPCLLLLQGPPTHYIDTVIVQLERVVVNDLRQFQWAGHIPSLITLACRVKDIDVLVSKCSLNLWSGLVRHVFVGGSAKDPYSGSGKYSLRSANSVISLRSSQQMFSVEVLSRSGSEDCSSGKGNCWAYRIELDNCAVSLIDGAVWVRLVGITPTASSFVLDTRNSEVDAYNASHLLLLQQLAPSWTVIDSHSSVLTVALHFTETNVTLNGNAALYSQVQRSNDTTAAAARLHITLSAEFSYCLIHQHQSNVICLVGNATIQRIYWEYSVVWIDGTSSVIFATTISDYTKQAAPTNPPPLLVEVSLITMFDCIFVLQGTRSSFFAVVSDVALVQVQSGSGKIFVSGTFLLSEPRNVTTSPVVGWFLHISGTSVSGLLYSRLVSTFHLIISGLYISLNEIFGFDLATAALPMTAPMVVCGAGCAFRQSALDVIVLDHCDANHVGFGAIVRGGDTVVNLNGSTLMPADALGNVPVGAITSQCIAPCQTMIRLVTSDGFPNYELSCANDSAAVLTDIVIHLFDPVDEVTVSVHQLYRTIVVGGTGRVTIEMDSGVPCPNTFTNLRPVPIVINGSADLTIVWKASLGSSGGTMPCILIEAFPQQLQFVQDTLGSIDLSNTRVFIRAAETAAMNSTVFVMTFSGVVTVDCAPDNECGFLDLQGLSHKNATVMLDILESGSISLQGEGAFMLAAHEFYESSLTVRQLNATSHVNFWLEESASFLFMDVAVASTIRFEQMLASLAGALLSLLDAAGNVTIVFAAVDVEAQGGEPCWSVVCIDGDITRYPQQGADVFVSASSFTLTDSSLVHRGDQGFPPAGSSTIVSTTQIRVHIAASHIALTGAAAQILIAYASVIEETVVAEVHAGDKCVMMLHDEASLLRGYSPHISVFLNLANSEVTAENSASLLYVNPHSVLKSPLPQSCKVTVSACRVVVSLYSHVAHIFTLDVDPVIEWTGGSLVLLNSSQLVLYLGGLERNVVVRLADVTQGVYLRDSHLLVYVSIPSELNSSRVLRVRGSQVFFLDPTSSLVALSIRSTLLSDWALCSGVALEIDASNISVPFVGTQGWGVQSIRNETDGSAMRFEISNTTSVLFTSTTLYQFTVGPDGFLSSSPTTVRFSGAVVAVVTLSGCANMHQSFASVATNISTPLHPTFRFFNAQAVRMTPAQLGTAIAPYTIQSCLCSSSTTRITLPGVYLIDCPRQDATSNIDVTVSTTAPGEVHLLVLNTENRLTVAGHNATALRVTVSNASFLSDLLRGPNLSFSFINITASEEVVSLFIDVNATAVMVDDFRRLMTVCSTGSVTLTLAPTAVVSIANWNSEWILLRCMQQSAMIHLQSLEVSLENASLVGVECAFGNERLTVTVDSSIGLFLSSDSVLVRLRDVSTHANRRIDSLTVQIQDSPLMQNITLVVASIGTIVNVASMEIASLLLVEITDAQLRLVSPLLVGVENVGSPILKIARSLILCDFHTATIGALFALSDTFSPVMLEIASTQVSNAQLKVFVIMVDISRTSAASVLVSGGGSTSFTGVVFLRLSFVQELALALSNVTLAVTRSAVVLQNNTGSASPVVYVDISVSNTNLSLVENSALLQTAAPLIVARLTNFPRDGIEVISSKIDLQVASVFVAVTPLAKSEPSRPIRFLSSHIAANDSSYVFVNLVFNVLMTQGAASYGSQLLLDKVTLRLSRNSALVFFSSSGVVSHTAEYALAHVTAQVGTDSAFFALNASSVAIVCTVTSSLVTFNSSTSSGFIQLLDGSRGLHNSSFRFSNGSNISLAAGTSFFSVMSLRAVLLGVVLELNNISLLLAPQFDNRTGRNTDNAWLLVSVTPLTSLSARPFTGITDGSSVVLRDVDMRSQLRQSEIHRELVAFLQVSTGFVWNASVEIVGCKNFISDSSSQPEPVSASSALGGISSALIVHRPCNPCDIGEVTYTLGGEYVYNCSVPALIRINLIENDAEFLLLVETSFVGITVSSSATVLNVTIVVDADLTCSPQAESLVVTSQFFSGKNLFIIWNASMVFGENQKEPAVVLNVLPTDRFSLTVGTRFALAMTQNSVFFRFLPALPSVTFNSGGLLVAFEHGEAPKLFAGCVLVDLRGASLSGVTVRIGPPVRKPLGLDTMVVSDAARVVLVNLVVLVANCTFTLQNVRFVSMFGGAWLAGTSRLHWSNCIIALLNADISVASSFAASWIIFFEKPQVSFGEGLVSVTNVSIVFEAAALRVETKAQSIIVGGYPNPVHVELRSTTLQSNGSLWMSGQGGLLLQLSIQHSDASWGNDNGLVHFYSTSFNSLMYIGLTASHSTLSGGSLVDIAVPVVTCFVFINATRAAVSATGFVSLTSGASNVTSESHNSQFHFLSNATFFRIDTLSRQLQLLSRHSNDTILFSDIRQTLLRCGISAASVTLLQFYNHTILHFGAASLLVVVSALNAPPDQSTWEVTTANALFVFWDRPRAVFPVLVAQSAANFVWRIDGCTELALTTTPMVSTEMVAQYNTSVLFGRRTISPPLLGVPQSKILWGERAVCYTSSLTLVSSSSMSRKRLSATLPLAQSLSASVSYVSTSRSIASSRTYTVTAKSVSNFTLSGALLLTRTAAPTFSDVLPLTRTATLPGALMPKLLVVSNAQTSAAFIGGLSLGGAGVTVQRAILSIQLQYCDFQLGEPLDLSSSPTQMQLGAGPLQHQRGAALGNLCVLVAVVMAGALGALVRRFFVERYRDRSMSLWRAAASLNLPGWLTMFWMFLLQPLLSAAVVLLTAGETIGDRILGSVVCALVAVVFAAESYMLVVRFAAKRVRVADHRSHRKRRLPIWTLHGVLQRLEDATRVTTSWQDTSTPHHSPQNFVKHYGALFGPYREGRQWFHLIDVMFGVVDGLIQGFSTVYESSVCSTMLKALCAFQGVYFVSLVGLRPHEERLDRFIALIMSSLGVGFSVLSVFPESCESCQEGAVTLASIQLYFSVVEVGVAVVQLVRSGRALRIYQRLRQATNRKLARSDVDIELQCTTTSDHHHEKDDRSIDHRFLRLVRPEATEVAATGPRVLYPRTPSASPIRSNVHRRAQQMMTAASSIAVKQRQLSLRVLVEDICARRTRK